MKKYTITQIRTELATLRHEIAVYKDFGHGSMTRLLIRLDELKTAARDLNDRLSAETVTIELKDLK